MKGKKFIQTLFLLSPFLLPHVAGAQIIISEINYNPSGTDSGFEWIEIYNTANQSHSIEGYFFTESGTDHKLKQVNESSGWVMPSDGYAIIVDDPEKFLQTNPGFPGLLFDSTFSLLNTGELLEIKDSDKNLLYGFNYSSAWGGNGDGSTLGLFENIWKSTEPTPGRENTLYIDTPETNLTEGVESNSLSGPEAVVTQAPVIDIPATYITLRDPEYKEKTIRSDAGPDKTVIAGVPFWFEGSAYGLVGGLLEDPEFSWNFGDGTRSDRSKTTHTYPNPGTYLGTLTAKSTGYRHTDHFEVTVIEPSISLITDTESQIITLQNTSPHTVEISGFKITAGTQKFSFPDESFITARAQISLSAAQLGLPFVDQDKILFLSPDGTELSSYHPIAEAIKNQISALEEEVTKQELLESKPVESAPDTPEQQIVYIRVPEITDLEIAPLAIESPTTAPASTQSAFVLQPAEKPTSLLEYILLTFVLISTALVGSFMFYKRRASSHSIEIEEL